MNYYSKDKTTYVFSYVQVNIGNSKVLQLCRN